MLPTVADILAMPALQVGVPEVHAGGPALRAEVRWVHISDSPDVARLLDGGELLLSTGAGWPTGPAALRAFAEGLRDAGVAGIVLELGTHHERMPDPVAEVCTESALALIALSREVKFVSVTEAVHRAIIDAQTGALHARQRLHELFTSLSLRGAPADMVVSETARALGAPVVLQNLAGEVIAAEGLQTPIARVLDGWSSDSRRDSLRGEDALLQVSVQARGTRWGTLVALPGPSHPAGRRTVLEQGATALAFGCLGDPDGAEWSLLAQSTVISDLLGARYATAEDIAARLQTGGFPLVGRRCHGVVVRDAGSLSALADRARAEGCAAMIGRADPDDILLLSLPPGRELSDAMATRIAGDSAPATLFIGPVAEGVTELLGSLRAARDLTFAQGGPSSRVRRVDARPLERLVAVLRDDHRLHEHRERMLAPLIRYDEGRRGDLLDVLGALVAHPGNRSAAAAASHLSRSVFYQRIALIADLLDVDLDDGEVLAALHLALVARPRTRAAD